MRAFIIFGLLGIAAVLKQDGHTILAYGLAVAVFVYIVMTYDKPNK